MLTDSPPKLIFERRIKHSVIVFCCFYLFACESTETWTDEYNVVSHLQGHHSLDCSNEEATKIASKAIEDEYPLYFEKFLNVGFNDWSPIYGEYNGEWISRYTYETIMAFKILYQSRYEDSYNIEKITVSLSQQCEVLDVDYFKGQITVTQ